MDEKRKLIRKRIWYSVLAVAGLALIIWGGLILDVYTDIKSTGIFDKQRMRTRDGTSVENMRALHTAIMQYYEDEGIMPTASGWMDAAEIYIHAADMPDSEAMKVFVNPNLSAESDVFGYALNSHLSGVYLDELEDPGNTIMIFESSDTSWNANGPPPELSSSEVSGGTMGITVDGVVVPLSGLIEDEPN